jgi:prepilin-type N-terminal cleavage/methylation domain-containing protein
LKYQVAGGIVQVLNNNKGYTLVEVIVTLTLLVVFLACTVAIVGPVLRVFNRTVALSEDQSIAMNIANYLAHKVNLSKEIEVANDGRTLFVDGVDYEIQDGYLVSSGMMILMQLIMEMQRLVFYLNKMMRNPLFS